MVVKWYPRCNFGMLVTIVFFINLFGAGSMALAAGISTVDPSTGTQGQNITLTITPDSTAQPPPPPNDIQPESAWIGNIQGTDVSRNTSTGVITATFAIPSDETYGNKDVKVIFLNPEQQEIELSKTGGFSVTSGIGADKVYVDADSSAQTPDGLSWSTAYTSLTDGIQAASGYGAAEVWAAQGTYKPTTGTDRTISFELISGIAVYGGFSGTETLKSQRNTNPETNNTVLSGDIGVAGTHTDNSYHVLTGADKAVLDGFTITKGYADGKLSKRMGGGMYNASLHSFSESPGIPTINNCLFIDNYAEEGGAIYNHFYAPAISNCTFSNNTANYGGAILLRVICGDNTVCNDADITNTQFTGNTAVWRGGAVFIDYGASSSFSNCTFTGNNSSGNGGAIYIDDRASQLGGTYPTFDTCTFTGNDAEYRGGAFAAYNSSCYPSLINCTFNNNTATQGGGGIALNQNVILTLTTPTYSGNSGGTGNADLDYDSTCTVQ